MWPFFIQFIMSLLMNKFLEEKIEVYDFNVKHYTRKLKGVTAEDSMYSFYCERLAESKLWLDVLYTARDAKADNPYSSC